MTDILDFQVVEIVGSFIQNNVQDIVKPSRSKWVFPTFAKKESSLPQVTIETGDPAYENDSAADYLKSETLDNGDYKEYYYKKATIPLHIYVLTQKEKELEVEYGGEKLFLTNKPLNIFLTNKIKQALWGNRGELLTYFNNFKINGVSTPFDSNKFSWSSDISAEIRAKEIWVKEFAQGELIAEYTLGITVLTS